MITVTDNRVTKQTLPTVQSLKNGQVFIHNDVLYLKRYFSDGGGVCVVGLNGDRAYGAGEYIQHWADIQVTPVNAEIIIS